MKRTINLISICIILIIPNVYANWFTWDGLQDRPSLVIGDDYPLMLGFSNSVMFFEFTNSLDIIYDHSFIGSNNASNGAGASATTWIDGSTNAISDHRIGSGTKFITVSNSSSLVYINGFSLFAWVKSGAFGTSPFYSAFKSSGTFEGISWETTAAVMQLWTRTSAGTGGWKVDSSGTTFNNNMWTSIAVTHDNTNTRFFVNGQLKSTVANAVIPGISGQDSYLMADSNIPHVRYCPGAIDTFYAVTSVLDTASISNLHRWTCCNTRSNGYDIGGTYQQLIDPSHGYTKYDANYMDTDYRLLCLSSSFDPTFAGFVVADQSTALNIGTSTFERDVDENNNGYISVPATERIVYTVTQPKVTYTFWASTNNVDWNHYLDNGTQYVDNAVQTWSNRFYTVSGNTITITNVPAVGTNYVDEFRVYTNSLDATQRTRLYNSGRGN